MASRLSAPAVTKFQSKLRSATRPMTALPTPHATASQSRCCPYSPRRACPSRSSVYVSSTPPPNEKKAMAHMMMVMVSKQQPMAGTMSSSNSALVSTRDGSHTHFLHCIRSTSAPKIWLPSAVAMGCTACDCGRKKTCGASGMGREWTLWQGGCTPKHSTRIAEVGGGKWARKWASQQKSDLASEKEGACEREGEMDSLRGRQRARERE
eukprot:3836834-Pleurochrysis_carterae.AAC.1